MIFLKSLYLKDFKSFEDETIEFIGGRNIIHGLNGAGKTTILLAILYALFGEVRRMGKMIQKKDLVRNGKNSFTVQLVFEINGEEYTVKRINFIDNRKAIAQLWKGKDLICEDQDPVTKDITELTGIDSITFQNVVYIGQGEIPQIASKDPADRKKLFDQFLNLDIYEDIHLKLRDAVAKTDAEIRIFTTRIHDLERDTSTLTTEENNLVEQKNRLSKRTDSEVELGKEFKSIQKDYEREDKKRIDIELLEKSKNEKLGQITKIEAVIAKKQPEIEAITTHKISLEEGELQNLLDLSKKEKADCEKKQKEAESFVKSQERLESELQAVGSRIEDNQRSQISRKSEAETNQETIIKDLPELKRLDYSIWQSSILSKKDISKNKVEQLESGRETALQKETQKSNLGAAFKSKEESMEKIQTNLSKAIKQIEKIDANWQDTLETFSAMDFDNLLQVGEQELNQLNKEMNSLNMQHGILEKSLNDKNQELEQIQLLKKGVQCPQCKQLVTQEHKAKIIEEIKTQTIKIQEELKEFSIKLENKNQELQDLQVKKDTLQRNYKLFQNLKPRADTIQDFESQLETEKNALEEMKLKIEEIIIDKPSNHYDKEISTENEKVATYFAILAKIDNINQARESLKELLNKENELTQKQNELIKTYQPERLKKEKEEIEKLNTELENKNQLIPAVSHIIERVIETKSLMDELEELKSSLDEKKKSFDQKKFKELIDKREALNRQLGEVKKEIETLSTELIPALESKIQDMKAKLKELNEKTVGLQKEKKKSNLITMLREFSRIIPPILREQKTREITAKASEIFLELIGESGEFDGIKVTENYDLYVTRFGTDEDISILSGGEQVISCLAIRLAISEILANQGLILLDEPTSHLDEGHIKDLVDVFQLYSPARQLITVTHDDEFEKIADSLIQVYKENGISQIL